MTIKLTVKGMHCKSCKMLIEDELEDLGATSINITVNEDAQMGQVSCKHPDESKVIDAIEELGEYNVTRSHE